MGCCLSTNKPPASPEFHRHSSKSSRAPPPVDEETVKEVLSETPNSNHFSNKIEDESTKYVPRKSLHKIQNHENHNLQDMNVSEICSTMSESNSTTTFEEDQVEVPRRRVTDRSPAKLRNPISGELRVARNSPVRGKQQSPGRVRSVSEMNNRGSGYYSAGRQRPAPATGQASRSRSPANRTAARGGGGGGARNGIGRSPSKRRMENSPSRSGSGLPERVLKPDVSPGLEREESRWDPNPTDGNDDESLDNPLVSLECFIFL